MKFNILIIRTISTPKRNKILVSSFRLKSYKVRVVGEKTSQITYMSKCCRKSCNKIMLSKLITFVR